MAYDFHWMHWPSNGWPRLKQFLMDTFGTLDATAEEINYLAGVTPGTAAASKAAVLGATKNLDTLLLDVATVAAAGANQSNAAAMTADTNLVTGANGTTGVRLPTAVAGRRIVVKNTVENALLKVYPATGAAINALGANAAISLPAGCLAIFVASGATQWYTAAVPDLIDATAAEIDQVCDGVSSNVTAANLSTQTGGGDVARAAGGHGHQLAAGASDVTMTAANINLLDDGGDIARAVGGHGHALAAGASDVTASAAEVNAAADDHTVVAGGAGCTAKRFVDSGLETADVDDLAVIGVSPLAFAGAASGVVQAGGLHPVVADAPLALGDRVKVGTDGRATKHTTSQTTIQALITGEAAAFTQPGAPTTLEILQAVDVAGDRGRGITLIGDDGAGNEILETINLDGADTNTPVAGAAVFATVSGVYTQDGLVLGAQDVTVRANGGGAGVCTLTGGTSELGADIPSGTQEAYCNELTLTGPNADATYVTVVGTNSAGASIQERVQFNGASPAKVTTATVWRYVDHICVGEFTNAGAGSAKTNDTPDTPAMMCGTVHVAAAARGDDALVRIDPNHGRHQHSLADGAVDVTMTAANLNLLDDGGDIARAVGGHGHLLAAGASDVTASAAQVNTLLRDPGKQATGVIDFNATGDAAMTITIDGVVYQEAGAEDLPNGVWTNGASAADSATSLAAAINGDARGGGSPFTAVVSAVGDSVVLVADAVGVAGNIVVASSHGSATAENTTGGAAAALKRVHALNRVVTAQDVLAEEVNIPLPFTPTAFVCQLLDTNGEVLETVTDRASIQAAPARIRVAFTGATHLIATDVVAVVAFE